MKIFECIKVILITLLILYFTITITFTILIVVQIKLKGKDIEYALDNKKYCNESFCPTTIENYDKAIVNNSNTYQKDMAKYLANLIVVVNENKIKNKQQGLVKIQEVYDISKKDTPFGVLYLDESNSTLFIIFRGTNNIKEWLQDFDIVQKKYNVSNYFNNIKLNNYKQKTSSILNNVSIHAGFVDIYSHFRDTIFKILKEKKPKKVIVSGHSLGAAVATICGVDLYLHKYDTTIYNFASPRIGGDNFLKLVEDYKIPIYRHVNDADIIPTLPPSIVPNFDNREDLYFYTHVGTVIPFISNRYSYINNHIMSCYKNYFNKT